eukprot:574291-Amphidinium_carterae.1
MGCCTNSPVAPLTQDTQVTILPYFTVPDGKMEEFKAGFKGCYSDSRAGTKALLYYGFAVCGNQVVVRESYKSAEAAVQHLKDVSDSVGKLLVLAGKSGLELN